MGFKPRTTSEINQFRIERTLKKLQRGETLTQSEHEELGRRFNRLERDSKVWYDDLHPKYIAICRKKSLLGAQ